MSGVSEKSASQLFQRFSWVLSPLLAVLSMLAMLSLLRGVMNALGLTSAGMSIDLAAYWSPARFLLTGGDPFQAALYTPEVLPTPASLLNMDADFTPLPGAAPLQLLVMTLLSALPWPAARFLFLLINLAAVLMIPWLLSRSVGLRYQSRLAIGLTLLFWALLPTRNALANGQTSALVLLAGLLAVESAHKRPIVSGILLALALTKFTLTLPLIAWFLLFSNWRPLVVAALLHLSAFPFVALIAGSRTREVFQNYTLVLGQYTPVVGDLNLSGLMTRWNVNGTVADVLSLAGIIVSFIGLVFVWNRLRTGFSVSSELEPICKWPLIAFLFAAALPFVYHSGYDAVVLIVLPYSALLLAGSSSAPGGGQTGMLATGWLFPASILLLSVFLLPRQSLVGFVPGWEHWLLTVSALAVFILWLLASWNIFKCVSGHSALEERAPR